MIVVSDTTPIHYLVLIGQAPLLCSLYGGVIVPEAVVAELGRSSTPEVVRDWMNHPPVSVKPAGRLDPSLDLGEGGCEAIALATRLHRRRVRGGR